MRDERLKNNNKMSKNHNPYLRLFTRDIEGSPKVNSLSMEASGLYFRLLNRLTEPPMPGSIALHDWEPHHTWQRSLTQQCLATPDKQERLQYFAKLLTRYFPWKTGDILKALKELYFYGIIEIEGDRLIQPRMYRDNGYKLESDPVDEADLDRATGAYIGDKNGDKNEEENEDKNKNKKSAVFSRTGVHARHALSNENKNNIINDNNKDNDKEKEEKEKTGENSLRSGKKAADGTNGGVMGDLSSDDGKTPQTSRNGQKTDKNRGESDAALSFDTFWDAYDKKVDRPACMALWEKLKEADKAAIMAYIPLYIRAQPQKKFRKNPATFLRHQSWEDEIIPENEVRPSGEPSGTGAAVKVTAGTKYRKI